MAAIQSGSINEAGFIRGMKRKGFNNNRAISELIQNSIDASSDNVTFEISKENIKLIDNGKGMDLGGLQNMWDAYRENHKDQESGGVSGLGSKPSTYVASQQTQVIIYTKSPDDKYYKAVVPWDEIVKRLEYSNMIQISLMDETEIKDFCSYIKATGTIINFKYNHDLYGCIIEQFNRASDIADISQRIDWIFAKFPSEISLITDEYPEPKILNKYNYFGGHPNDYYLIHERDIIIFEHRNGTLEFGILISENRYEYFKKNKIWTKKSFDNWREYKIIGNIGFKCGLRKDDKYFDYSNPIIPGASKRLLEYDSNFFKEGGPNSDVNGDDIKLSLWQPHISRNSQNIGVIDRLPNLNPASARAAGQQCLVCNHIRTDINYNVISTQDNIMDEIMGIQENKNQLNSNLPPSLLRMIEFLMKETGTLIWKDFERRVKEKYEKERVKAEEAKAKAGEEAKAKAEEAKAKAEEEAKAKAEEAKAKAEEAKGNEKESKEESEEESEEDSEEEHVKESKEESEEESEEDSEEESEEDSEKYSEDKYKDAVSEYSTRTLEFINVMSKMKVEDPNSFEQALKEFIK